MVRPKLWQRSKLPFWDDEHISKGMLEAHLNIEWDAASRKLETICKSVEWISSLLPKGAAILDLGCGPGLYGARLSSKGFSVTGVDVSKRSIEYAKTHDMNSQYLNLNYVDDELSGSYDAVLMIYCDYAALSAPERRIVLNKIKGVLKPGGFFLFDVFNESVYERKIEKAIRVEYPNGGFWYPGAHVVNEGLFLFPEERASVTYDIIEADGEKREYLIWDTCYSLERLSAELASCGFRCREIYDDVCGAVYSGESDTICVICICK